MTDRHAADERLREAFRALGDASQKELSPEDVDRVWQAVSGALPAAERRDLVDRMATDPALAEAWRGAQELWQAAGQKAHFDVRASRMWTPAWLAAAAVLIVGLAAGVVLQRSASRDSTFREGGSYVIESLVQPDATLSRDAFRLRWTPGPRDSRYQVTVTTEDLRVLTTVPDLTVPELTIESASALGRRAWCPRAVAGVRDSSRRRECLLSDVCRACAVNRR